VRPADDQPFTLTFALRHSNLSRIHEMALSVATPDSPNYGRYLSMEELTELVSPPQTVLDCLIQWIKGYDPIRYDLTQNRDYLVAVVRVKDAEKILNCRFEEFVHSPSETKMRRCAEDQYSLPHQIAQHVRFVGSALRLPKIKSATRLLNNNRKRSIYVTPAVIKSLYNITAPKPSPTNIQAVSSFLGEYWAPSDLVLFQQKFGLPSIPIEHQYGPNDPSNPGLEASLDVQYITGVSGAGQGSTGPNTRTWVYYTPGNRSHDDEPFLTWLVFMSNQTQIPYVFSISYGDYEYWITDDYLDQVNGEFAKFSLRGRTFVYASGDEGVGCRSDFFNCQRFVADFPADSPYVVAVGSTVADSTTKEIGVSFSTGGFSWYFKRPSYQDAAVQNYFKNTNVPDSYFNRNGRGFPDVSTVGANFEIAYSGFFSPVSGTSCSAPTFASMLSMINSIRISKRLPTLGWVNPFLYKAAGAFKDITSCEEQARGCCPVSFNCIAGWDPYTGLGTPDFGKLSRMAMDANFFNFPEAPVIDGQ